MYLEKKIIRTIKASKPAEDDPIDDEDLDLKDDAFTLDVEHSKTISCEYHVVYNISYSVPVLYFNFWKNDGHLLSLQDVWDLVLPVHKEALFSDRWSVLTQQEHPLLGRPFFQLHPCRTAELMAKFEPLVNSPKGNYLVSWLSMIGPVIGLEMPLTYGILLEKDNEEKNEEGDKQEKTANENTS